ncbi:MAG: hypothetical protein E4G94_00495 [ANME-2 cluster archaeon]|nr:MAG: hypothetical protein E4G94_00495 [ANME-2 cluster archaeon]
MKLSRIVMVVLASVLIIIMANATSNPTITSWSNSKTNDDATYLTINLSEEVNFNATADQLITNWTWYRGSTELDNNYDNLTTFWNSIGEKTVRVQAENENGTSNIVVWTVNVTDNDTDYPEIISWGSSKTGNFNLEISIQMEESISFFAKTDQPISSWNWYKDGIPQSDNIVHDDLNSFFTTSWDNMGVGQVSVNATNENGTSNTVTWEIEVLSNTGLPTSKGREIDSNLTLGDLLGDLIVLVRDDNGEPVLDINGCYRAVNKTDLNWIN